MNTLAINTSGDELDVSTDYCRAEGIGLEVTAFAVPINLDGDIPALVKSHRIALTGITPVLAHGPFLDLVATSQDPAIVAVARRRHEVALAAAVHIGASFYIAHTNFTPLIRNPPYRKNWTNRMLEFWLPLADTASKHNIIICLENMWEPAPDIQTDLIAAAQHPHLRASLDNGHALVFSTIPTNSWVEALGVSLGHCHLHDNSGELDEHQSIGSGKENWPDLIAAIKEHAPQAILVAESVNLESNKASIEQLKNLNYI
jgi:sugar phosphate isomerase/epimerase